MKNNDHSWRKNGSDAPVVAAARLTARFGSADMDMEMRAALKGVIGEDAVREIERQVEASERRRREAEQAEELRTLRQEVERLRRSNPR
jgi:hypothetical protein